MVHEHPGVYSSYDASSVIGGKKTARILGAAAVSTTGTANEVVTLTSYAEGVSAFGEDAEGTVGMAALLAALYRNGAAVVKAVKVSAATPTGYEAAFAALVFADTLFQHGKEVFIGQAHRKPQALPVHVDHAVICQED